MKVEKIIIEQCHECGYRTYFTPELRIISTYGNDSYNVVPCFVCSDCGKAIPTYAWNEYQRTGTIILSI